MTSHPGVHSLITKYSDFAFKSLVLLGIFCMLYLQNHYVPREEFDGLKNDVITIQSTLRVMAESNLVNNRQDSTLADHEQRIRILEQRRP